MWITNINNARGFGTEGRGRHAAAADRMEREREGTSAATTIESSVKTPRKKEMAEKVSPSLP